MNVEMDASKDNQANEEDDDEEEESSIQRFLLDLSKLVQENDGLTAKQRIQQVPFSAETLLSVLTPHLFDVEPTSMMAINDVHDDNDNDDEEQKTLASTDLSESQALQLLHFLASQDPIHFPMPLIAQAVAHAAAENAASSISSPRPMHVSKDLLQTLLHQVCFSESVKVMEMVTQTLWTCSHKLGPPFLQEAIPGLVQLWKQALNPTDTYGRASSKHVSSTVAVRCATVMIEWFLPTQQQHPLPSSLSSSLAIRTALFAQMVNHGATTLFVQMLQDKSDPLVQMSMLDLLERFVTATTATTTTNANTTAMSDSIEIRQWLSSLHVLEPILQMAGVTITNDDHQSQSKKVLLPNGQIDSLLGGSALRLLSALCTTTFHEKNNQPATTADAHQHHSDDYDYAQQQQQEQQQDLFLLHAFQQALHNFATAGSGEVDRLHLITAISSFAATSHHALEAILQDQTIRSAWLSIRHVAQTKLKAAILLSIAMVLDPTLLMQSQETTTTLSSTTMTTTPTTRTNLYDSQSSSVESKLAIQLFTALGTENTTHPYPSSTSSSSLTSTTTDYLFLQYGRSPIPELRWATYTLLSAMAKHHAPYIFMTTEHLPSFLEWLLDRTVETTQDGRIAKFHLVQTLVSHPHVPTGIIHDSQWNKLRKHIQQGPHYIRPIPWDVAAE